MSNARSTSNVRSRLIVTLVIGGLAASATAATAQGAQEPGSGCAAPIHALIENAGVPEGFCAWRWATDLGAPRGIIVDDSGDVLVVSRADSTLLLHDDDGDGISTVDERLTLASLPGLNHGLALNAGYLYASTPTTVYRWPYPGDRKGLGDPEPVIRTIPGGGFHTTRTLQFADGYLHVSVGSAGNIDQDSSRARIRRFAISELGGSVLDFNGGEVFADGLRNEVGLAVDPGGRLWGVGNGRDELRRAIFEPSDIHQDNPAEPLHLFAGPGRFYGYPYCWPEFLLPAEQGMGSGTMWVEQRFMLDGLHDDGWCRDPENVTPPVLAMQAHSAPLDLLFYESDSWPEEYQGDALVTFHGSWNRTEPTGYKVMRIPIGDDGMPEGELQPLLEYAGEGDLASGWPHRPVAMAIAPGGRLLVSSDNSGTILAIDYGP